MPFVENMVIVLTLEIRKVAIKGVVKWKISRRKKKYKGMSSPLSLSLCSQFALFDSRPFSFRRLLRPLEFPKDCYRRLYVPLVAPLSSAFVFDLFWWLMVCLSFESVVTGSNHDQGLSFSGQGLCVERVTSLWQVPWGAYGLKKASTPKKKTKRWWPRSSPANWHALSLQDLGT